jgi:hypothetical protein
VVVESEPRDPGRTHIRDDLTEAEAEEMLRGVNKRREKQKSRRINQALTAHTSLTITEPCRYAYRIATEGLLG